MKGKICHTNVVIPVHKNTDAPLIILVCDVIFCKLAKHVISDFSRFLRGP